jgi:hypothetical protein
MTSKSTLVLCDTGVIIESFRIKIWDSLVSHYNIVLSKTIIEEALYYYDDDGAKHYIDLSIYISSIQVIDPSYSELQQFISKFNPSYCERMDPGELSLLCHLFTQSSSELLICSGDGIVYKVLGIKRCSDKGISLEELLLKMGFSKPIKDQFKKHFRDYHSKQGLSDSFF